MKWSYPDGNKANHTSEPLFWSCVSRWEIVMHVFWQPVWTLSWLTTTANEWLKRRGETTSCLIFRARSEWVKNLPSSAQCRKQIRKRLTGASRVLPDVVRPCKNSKGGWLTCHTPPKTNSSPWKNDGVERQLYGPFFTGHACIFGGCTSTTSQVEIPTPWFIEP